MRNDDEIISGFGCEGEQMPFAIDFNLATPLDRAGSTCDTFECTIQHRRAFVKRLKAEYRDNPVYREAFRKEFELGVGLDHVSLPRYVCRGDDYVVMDYVEGDTLADLMRRGDPRLKSKRYVRTLLAELIDVVGYLHNRRVVHCDVKPDNIIMSPHPDRPLMLIDLDKAYTSWCETTHGNAAIYGCEDCADGQIDFRGIAMIADRLGERRMARACGRAGVTAECLKRALDHNDYPLRWAIAGMAAAVVVAILFIPSREAAVGSRDEEPMPAHVADTVPLSAAAAPELQAPPIDRRWISELIAQKAADLEAHRRRLWTILDCDTIPIGIKRDAIDDYNGSCGMAMTEIIYDAVRHFSAFSEPDVQCAVREHPGWIRLEKDDGDVQAKLREWNAKVSQRPSDHPASQPDTLPGASRPAPHL